MVYSLLWLMQDFVHQQYGSSLGPGVQGQVERPDLSPTWRFMGLSKYGYKYPKWGYK